MSSTTKPNTWMMRAGEGARLLDLFLEKNIIALGWNEIGELAPDTTYEQLKEKLTSTYPDNSQGRINQSAGQIWKFFKVFKPEDRIVTYDPNARCYYTGKITSDYHFNESYEYHHVRSVEWDDEGIDRDSLSTWARNLLGSILTIFNIPDEFWVERHEFALDQAGISDAEWADMEAAAEQFHREEEGRIAADLISRSSEFVKDLLVALSWQELEQVTAGLMRGMGYKTQMTSKGADLGSDILVSPDGLGMVEPRIKVEVKHKVKSKEKVGADMLRNFIGGLRTEKGLYVSTTGFTKEAHYEAERANFSITLIDADRLVELLVENYEKLEPEIKAMVPLRKIYWPA